jgi:hypothetical protein
MSLTYILIDFENVQPTAADMGLIRGADYRVRLFHGPHQNRFDASMVKALQPLGSQLEYVQGELKGKNALDFQIAFYLGRLVEACKASVSPLAKGTAFVIVSKDAGFDALVGPFRAVGYRAARTPTVADAIAFAEAKDVRATSEPAGETGASSGKARAAKVVPSQSKAPASQSEGTDLFRALRHRAKDRGAGRAVAHSAEAVGEAHICSIRLWFRRQEAGHGGERH